MLRQIVNTVEGALRKGWPEWNSSLVETQRAPDVARLKGVQFTEDNLTSPSTEQMDLDRLSFIVVESLPARCLHSLTLAFRDADGQLRTLRQAASYLSILRIDVLVCNFSHSL